MPFVLKIQLGQDIRRLSMDQLPAFDELKHLIRSMFDVLSSLEFNITYKDEDEDLIGIKSDLDLQEARSLLQRDHNLRLFVVPVVGGPTFVPYPTLQAAVPESDKPIYSVQSSPEDIDFTTTFTDLGQIKTEEQVEKEPLKPIEALPLEAKNEQTETNLSEAEFHRSLEALAEDPSNDRVLDSIEEKFKCALEAFTNFMDSLHLRSKFKNLTDEFEQTLAKVEHSFFQPIERMAQKTGNNIKDELEKFKDELVVLKQKFQARLKELESDATNADVPVNAEAQPAVNPSTDHASSSSPNQIPEVPLVNQAEPPKSAIADLKTLADMGFTDRDRKSVV